MQLCGIWGTAWIFNDRCIFNKMKIKDQGTSFLCLIHLHDKLHLGNAYFEKTHQSKSQSKRELETNTTSAELTTSISTVNCGERTNSSNIVCIEPTGISASGRVLRRRQGGVLAGFVRHGH